MEMKVTVVWLAVPINPDKCSSVSTVGTVWKDSRLGKYVTVNAIFKIWDKSLVSAWMYCS